MDSVQQLLVQILAEINVAVSELHAPFEVDQRRRDAQHHEEHDRLRPGLDHQSHG